MFWDKYKKKKCGACGKVQKKFRYKVPGLGEPMCNACYMRMLRQTIRFRNKNTVR